MADVWLTGKIVNVNIDRDTQFTLTVPSVDGLTRANQVLEVQRIRTNGSVEVAAALKPTLLSVSGALVATWTTVMTGLMHDLVGPRGIARFRYRIRCETNGGQLRTLIAGKLNVGPIGFAQGGETLTIPVEVNTGDIIVGDVTIIGDPEDPDNPDDPDDPDPEDPQTPATAVKWDSNDYEMWEDDVFVTWTDDHLDTERDGQNYAERAAAEPLLAAIDDDNNTAILIDDGQNIYVRINGELLSFNDFAQLLSYYGGYEISNEMQSNSNSVPAVIATAATDTPTAQIMRAELEDGTLVGSFGRTYNANAQANGFVSAGNVFESRVFFRFDQVEPPGIVAGNFRVRPRV